MGVGLLHLWRAGPLIHYPLVPCIQENDPEKSNFFIRTKWVNEQVDFSPDAVDVVVSVLMVSVRDSFQDASGHPSKLRKTCPGG